MRSDTLIRLGPLVLLAAGLTAWSFFTHPVIPSFEWRYLLFAALIAVLSTQRIALPTGERLNPAIPVAAATAILIPAPLGPLLIGISTGASSLYLARWGTDERRFNLVSSPLQSTIAAFVCGYVATSLTQVDYTAYPNFAFLSWSGFVLLLATGLYQLLDVVMEEIGLNTSTFDVKLSPRQLAETITELFPPHFSLVCLSVLSVVMVSSLGAWILLLTMTIVLVIGHSVSQYALAVRDRSRTLISLATATIGGEEKAPQIRDAMEAARTMARQRGLTRRDSTTATDALLVCLVSTIAADGDPADRGERTQTPYEVGISIVRSLDTRDALRSVVRLVGAERSASSTPTGHELIADIVEQVLPIAAGGNNDTESNPSSHRVQVV